MKKIMYVIICNIVLFQYALVTGSMVFAEEIINWECRVNGNNNGCKKTIRAPRGKIIVSVTAACNLEYGAVSAKDLKSVATNTIKVIRASDKRWYETRGSCFVGNTKVYTGKKTIKGVKGVSFIRIGCKEYDKNGGDCHIKGTISIKNGKGGTENPRDRIKIKRICGIGNCPIGFHDKSYSRNSRCGNTIYLNETICQNNVGSSFYKCGIGNCPNGYRKVSTNYNSACALGNTLSHNQTHCVRK